LDSLYLIVYQILYDDRIAFTVDCIHDLTHQRHNRALVSSLDNFLNNLRVLVHNIIYSSLNLGASYYGTNKSQIICDLIGSACVVVNDSHHYLLAVSD